MNKIKRHTWSSEPLSSLALHGSTRTGGCGTDSNPLDVIQQHPNPTVVASDPGALP